MTTTPPASAGIRTFEIDRSHSEVAFQVRHLFGRVRGRFTDFAGQIQYDESQPENSRVDVVVHAVSIDTAEPDRDKHLRTGDFFEVEKYPTLTFHSTSVQPKGDGLEVTGDLTIHGVTKRITFPATLLGAGRDAYGAEKVGFEAEFKINRKDFGLHWNAPLETGGFLVGDEVKVMISVQAKVKG
jgi:polyisoprenoid-binding protein YceI